MERDFAAYLFTLFCPLFTSGASFSIAHEYSVRNLNGDDCANKTGGARTAEMSRWETVVLRRVDPVVAVASSESTRTLSAQASDTASVRQTRPNTLPPHTYTRGQWVDIVNTDRPRSAVTHTQFTPATKFLCAGTLSQHSVWNELTSHNPLTHSGVTISVINWSC